MPKIRDARPVECGLLSALALRSKAHWDYSDDFLEACRDELTYTAEQISDEDYAFRVIEADDRIAGFFALHQVSASELELEALFVEPECIGTGLGKALMDAACLTLAESSASIMRIQGDPNAQKFYIDAGAELVGVRESESIPGRFLPLFELRI